MFQYIKHRAGCKPKIPVVSIQGRVASVTQFLIIQWRYYQFTSYYNEEEMHMNCIQGLPTIASEGQL
jgi:hypothetical protein